ncbi:hypothetical protein [Streptomyces griseus]|uniref:hypothetical protein n=1 Tax=Streptomyces griseus TaxID=1911 RepID=UPI000A39DA73|nr:hypothetical protein [Streptomyces fimicarius]
MSRLDDKQRETVAEHSSLGSIRTLLRTERTERRRVDERIGWLEELLDHRLDQVAAGTWPGPEDEAEEPVPELCPQNRRGDRAVLQPHHYPPGSDQCVFCTGRTYVFNSRSVNRMWKHAHDGAGRTLCPSALQATDPMPDDEAARLTLCSGCRTALITPTDSQENPHA